MIKQSDRAIKEKHHFPPPSLNPLGSFSTGKECQVAKLVHAGFIFLGCTKFFQHSDRTFLSSFGGIYTDKLSQWLSVFHKCFPPLISQGITKLGWEDTLHIDRTVLDVVIS